MNMSTHFVGAGHTRHADTDGSRNRRPTDGAFGASTLHSRFFLLAIMTMLMLLTFPVRGVHVVEASVTHRRGWCRVQRGPVA